MKTQRDNVKIVLAEITLWVNVLLAISNWGESDFGWFVVNILLIVIMAIGIYKESKKCVKHEPIVLARNENGFVKLVWCPNCDDRLNITYD